MPTEININVGKLTKCKMACPLCGEPIEIRLDRKHGKPYCICDPCGLQMFVRRKPGIEKLAELQAFAETGTRINRQFQIRMAEIQGTLAEIEGIEREITKLKPRTGFLSSNETAIATRKALENRRARLFKNLEELSPKDGTK